MLRYVTLFPLATRAGAWEPRLGGLFTDPPLFNGPFCRTGNEGHGYAQCEIKPS